VRHGLNATTHWKLGHPGVTVSKIAEAGEYDMVIMGSHGHGALVNLVTGSVATQVLAQCKVPVLLIR
jgi:nucleotide-binding universal stress UspA family protein